MHLSPDVVTHIYTRTPLTLDGIHQMLTALSQSGVALKSVRRMGTDEVGKLGLRPTTAIWFEVHGTPLAQQAPDAGSRDAEPRRGGTRAQ